MVTIIAKIILKVILTFVQALSGLYSQNYNRISYTSISSFLPYPY